MSFNSACTEGSPQRGARRKRSKLNKESDRLKANLTGAFDEHVDADSEDVSLEEESLDSVHNPFELDYDTLKVGDFFLMIVDDTITQLYIGKLNKTLRDGSFQFQWFFPAGSTPKETDSWDSVRMWIDAKYAPGWTVNFGHAAKEVNYYDEYDHVKVGSVLEGRKVVVCEPWQDKLVRENKAAQGVYGPSDINCAHFQLENGHLPCALKEYLGNLFCFCD